MSSPPHFQAINKSLGHVRTTASRVDKHSQLRRTMRGGEPSPLGLHTCDRTREALAEPRTFKVNRSRVAARNRRRDKSVDRWHHAMTYDRVCRRRVWLLLFTTESAEPEVVEGAMRRFWHAVRDRFGKQNYWAGLEVQRRGAAHYHAMWVDPPLKDNAATKRWLEATWSLGFVKLKQRSASWFALKAGNYIKSEIKESEGKAYQHDYSEIPSSIKTCMYGELEFYAHDLDMHGDRQVVVYVPQAVQLRTGGADPLELAQQLLAANDSTHRPDSHSPIRTSSTEPRGDSSSDVSRRAITDVAEHLVQVAELRHREHCAGDCTLWRSRRNLRINGMRPAAVAKQAPLQGGSSVSTTGRRREGVRSPLRRQ